MRDLRGRRASLALVIGVIAASVIAPVAQAGVSNQPDLLVRRIGRHNTVGNNIYNEYATGQTLTATATEGRVRFVITVQNDGAEPDSFTIGDFPSVGPIGPVRPSGPTPLGFASFAYGWPATDITLAVNSGQFTTPTIQPGGTFKIRAAVQTSYINGGVLGVLVRAKSNANSSSQDSVAFTVTVPAH